MKKIISILLVFIMVLCSCQKAEKKDLSNDTLNVSVAVENVKVADIKKDTSFSGRVSPDESVYVIAKANAPVSKIYKEVGDYVEAGELLFEMDTKDIMISVNQAKAAYDSAKANVDQALGSGLTGSMINAEAGKKQAKLAYDAAEEGLGALDTAISSIGTLISTINKTSASDLGPIVSNKIVESVEEEYSITRPSPLNDTYKNDLIKALGKYKAELQSSYDSAELGYEQAEEAYKLAKKSYSLLIGQGTAEAQNVANAGLEQARIAYESALTQVDNCKVKAPISGTIEAKTITLNNYPNGYTYIISNKDTMCVKFGVPAETSRFLSIGDKVIVENGSVKHDAEIVEIGNMINQTSGLFDVKCNITDDSSDLLTGIAVKLTLVTSSSEDATLVPTNSIYYDNGKAYIYIIDDGIAKKEYITLGIVNDDYAEVISDLSPLTKVITTWDSHLRDGVKVSIKEG